MCKQSVGMALVVVVGALLCQGCAYFVTPEVRDNWASRLFAAQSNLKTSRQEISRVGAAAEENQIAFIDEASKPTEGEWPAEDIADTKRAVRERAATQVRFLNEISNVETELELLRYEILGVK